MAVLSLWQAVRWSIGIYLRRLITTTQLALRRDLGAEFGRRDEEVRTVSARSRRAALSRFAPANPLPPLPMPFFPNTHRPSLPLVLRRLARFPSKIPSIPIRHQHPFFMVPIRARCPASPCFPLCRLYTKNERGGG